jgi:hypothetical protein
MSTFIELYSDFQEEVKLYHPDATVSDRMFMRYLTRAARNFQRMTKVVENKKTIYADNEFFLGNDILQIIEITDEDNNPLMPMEYKQARHEVQLSGQAVQGVNETYAANVSLMHWRRRHNRAENVAQNDLGKVPPPTGDESWGQHTRVFTVAANRVVVYPDTLNGVADELLQVYYYEDVLPYSSQEEVWKQWFLGDEEFALLFQNTGFNAPLSQYEDTILKGSTIAFLAARLDNDRLSHLQREYKEEVQYIIENKPTLFRGGVAMYNLTPNTY